VVVLAFKNHTRLFSNKKIEKKQDSKEEKHPVSTAENIQLDYTVLNLTAHLTINTCYLFIINIPL
jgi:hypothetical protein